MVYIVVACLHTICRVSLALNERGFVVIIDAEVVADGFHQLATKGQH